MEKLASTRVVRAALVGVVLLAPGCGDSTEAGQIPKCNSDDLHMLPEATRDPEAANYRKETDPDWIISTRREHLEEITPPGNTAAAKMMEAGWGYKPEDISCKDGWGREFITLEGSAQALKTTQEDAAKHPGVLTKG